MTDSCLDKISEVLYIVIGRSAVDKKMAPRGYLRAERMATDVTHLFAESITYLCCLRPRNSYLERPSAFLGANVRQEYAEELDC